MLVLYLIDKQLKGNKEIKVKDTLKAFNDSRNKQQKSMKQYFLIYILKVYSIEKTEKIREKTQIIKVFFSLKYICVKRPVAAKLLN